LFREIPDSGPDPNSHFTGIHESIIPERKMLDTRCVERVVLARDAPDTQVGLDVVQGDTVPLGRYSVVF